MNPATPEATSQVPPDEVERRVAEYRRVSFERHLPAQVVYPGPKAACPWPDCGLRIMGIRFQLEEMGDTEQVARWLVAWWIGPGLAARCPGCDRYVLLGVTGKHTADDPATAGLAALPDDWHLHAYIA